MPVVIFFETSHRLKYSTSEVALMDRPSPSLKLHQWEQIRSETNQKREAYRSFHFAGGRRSGGVVPSS
jgi:hypothetical protein